MPGVVPQYLDLMDSQRESTFAATDRLTHSQLWQRPAPNEWSIGEILDHNYLVTASMLLAIRWMWNLMGWYGRLCRHRSHKTEIVDLYRNPNFPQWVGFLWTPRFNTRRPIPLESLKVATREIHAKVWDFYGQKDENILGNLYLYDPIFGWCNLIVTLRIGIYHDQWHYDDVIKRASHLKL